MSPESMVRSRQSASRESKVTESRAGRQADEKRVRRSRFDEREQAITRYQRDAGHILHNGLG
jgi:hypothetical protein